MVTTGPVTLKIPVFNVFMTFHTPLTKYPTISLTKGFILAHSLKGYIPQGREDEIAVNGAGWMETLPLL